MESNTAEAAESLMLVRPASEFVEKYGESEFYTTRLFPNREEWLKGREGHLGASCAYKVIDTEQRKRLFEEMTGEKEREDLSGNVLVARGSVGEQFIRAIIAVENPDWEIYDGTHLIFYSKRKPFMSASLDCIAVNRLTGEIADIEIKEAPWSAKWKGDYAPSGYFAQVCHQHYVTGFNLCVLHPRIYLTKNDGGFTTSFERSYEWDMTAPEIAEQVAAIVEDEEKFWDELQDGRYTPRLNLPSLF